MLVFIGQHDSASLIREVCSNLVFRPQMCIFHQALGVNDVMG
jgi:hypothetical protein